MSPETLLARLQAVLPAAAFPADTSPFLTDQRCRYQSRDAVVVQPANTEEVQVVVRFCAANRIAVVPQGGNTGLVGGSVAQGGVLLNLGRLNRIRSISTDDNAIIAESGCILHNVKAAAAGADRFFPLDLASGGSCQIGGNIACNAGGLNVLRYGTMRDLVLGLEVVLPDGEILSHLPPLHKNTTGYDLKNLFVGSEGTLGVITAATLKLFSPVRSLATAWVGVPDIAAAVRLLALVRNRFAERLCSFELVGRFALELSSRFSSISAPTDAPWHVLIELADSLPQAGLDDMLAEHLFENGFGNTVLAQNGRERADLWMLRENISAAQRSLGTSIKHDIALPVANVAAFAADTERSLLQVYPDMQIVLFGHLGDGSLHYNTFLPNTPDNGVYVHEAAVNRLVYQNVLHYHGTIAAEHGIGSLKKDWLSKVRSPSEIALMRAVKRELDPHGLFNPNVLFV